MMFSAYFSEYHSHCRANLAEKSAVFAGPVITIIPETQIGQSLTILMTISIVSFQGY
jgi:hypothetical protein